MEWMFFFIALPIGFLIICLIIGILIYEAGVEKGKERNDEYWHGRITMNNVGKWTSDPLTGSTTFVMTTLPADFDYYAILKQHDELLGLLTSAEEWAEEIRTKNDNVLANLTVAIGRLNEKPKQETK